MSEVTFEELVEFARSNIACCGTCSISHRQFCFSVPVTLCKKVKEHYDWIQSHKTNKIEGKL